MKPLMTLPDTQTETFGGSVAAASLPRQVVVVVFGRSAAQKGALKAPQEALKAPQSLRSDGWLP